MQTARSSVRRQTRHARAAVILTTSILSLAGPAARAATYTWNNFTVGPNNWSVGANWLDPANMANAPLGSDPTLDILFPGGLGVANTNNDIASLLLNTLTLSGGAAEPITISGSSLDFRTDDTAAQVTQNGAGTVLISAPIIATSPLTLGGSGTGVVTLSGVISGGGGLTFGGASWKLTNVANSFTGGLTINTGAFVDLAPGGGGNQSVNITPAATSIAGGNGAANALTINGGTFKLTTSGTGNVTFGDNRALTFGANGGTLDVTNSNTVTPPAQGGGMAGGNNDLALTLNNTAANIAVIKFNGGQVGLSNNAANDGNWTTANNTLRIESYAGTGPLRVEMTNGAMFFNRPATIGVPLTVRGVAGGDPTSGPNATVNANLSLNMGRMAVDNQNVYGFTQGLTYEDAVQVGVAGSTRALDGNITVAGSAGGHAGYVSFNGRGTGTALGATLNNPGTNTAGMNPLWIGQGGNDILTIQNGGIAVFDLRVRHEQLSNNGVVLNAKAVIQGGGQLRLWQSLSRNTAAQAAAAGQIGTNSTTSVVGTHVIDGNIEGQGTTANEALLNIHLPIQPGTDTNADQIPDSAFGDLGGVVFRTSSNLVVNGTGFGGLRVNGLARPNNLFTPAGPDPVTNSAKVNNLLTVARVSALTGNGGYLTVAPANETYTFPNAEWSPAVNVGLKVVNQNPGGVDLQFDPAKTNWGHSLAVDAGAELNTGASPFNFTVGTLFGTGTVSGVGGLTVAAGATVSPGFSLGTLTVGNITINGALQFEATNTPSSDLLAANGNMTLGGTSVLNLSGSNTYNNADYTIATYSGLLTGTFGSVTNLPVGYSVDYSTAGSIKLHFSAVVTRIWNGDISGAWDHATANWQGAGIFVDADSVVFDDTATGPNFNIAVSGGDVSPGLITVNNSAISYSITSSAGNAIVGPGQLVKNGNGTLTLSGPAVYVGGTTINAGELRLGANDSLPNTGAISVAAAGTLNTQGNSDTVGDLSVDGTVTGGGTLTVNSLTLGSGATFSPNLVLNGNVTKAGSEGSTLPGAINLNGARTVSVASGTAPELTLNGVISNGSLTKAGNGTLVLGNAGNTYSGGTTISAGTLKIGAAGALPANTPLTVNGGTLDGNNTAIAVSSLGGAGGTLSLGSGSLHIVQTIDTTFSGAATGSAIVTKSGTGVLTLSGAASTYTGGLYVDGGIAIVTTVGAPGNGVSHVQTGGTLQVAANLTTPIILEGGTLATQGSPGQVTANDLTAATGTTSTVLLAQANNLANNSEVILVGTLGGTGNINVQAGSANASPDGGPGFRLRGTSASGFNGTVTAAQSTKLEMQTAVTGAFSPGGTGKFVLTGGTYTAASTNGNYSVINIRNNSAGNAILGNDFEVAGTGFAMFNMPGSAPVGAITQIGNLKIGNNQTAGVYRNAGNLQVLQVTSVTLTGGTSTFTSNPIGFGVSGTANLALGPISETAPANIVLAPGTNTAAGTGTIVLGAANTYTGTTTIPAGTTGTILLGAVGALPATTNLTVDAGTLDLNNNGASFDQTIASLSGAGGTITNSDSSNTRTLTVNETITTTFAGAVTGNLALTKELTGTLILSGANTYPGLTTVNGGTLLVDGSISGSVNLSGGTLGGNGTTGPVTVNTGGTLSPGDSPGILHVGNVQLNDQSTYAVELFGTTPGNDFDQLSVTGGVQINGQVALNVSLGTFDPLDFVDVFPIILNDLSDPVQGTFYSLPNGATFNVAGQDFIISYQDDASTPEFELTGGNDVSVMAVPEPGSTMLLIGGLLTIVGLRRRKEL